jgi:hypothetical protein
MPMLQVRTPGEVPMPSRAPRAVRERQQEYDNFIRSVDGTDVGDLEMQPGEDLRSVKILLRRASTRLNINIEMWDVSGHVYFRRSARRRRARRQIPKA